MRPALAAPPAAVPLGLYLHIPFCRKRCHFCYFRVYTDKNAKEVQAYLDTLAHECELYAQQPAIAGRALNFVYFGGGTPSFLSTRQLQSLVSTMDAGHPWREAEEITFECEPGTLTEAKLDSAARDLASPAESRHRELRRSRCWRSTDVRIGHPRSAARTRLRGRCSSRRSTST